VKDDDENCVIKLPVKFKARAPDERTLVSPWEVLKHVECDHLMATYIINEREADVECGRCGTRLNPMWVLKELATSDRRYAQMKESAKQASERRADRVRCKCQHCGKMTRIRGL